MSAGQRQWQPGADRALPHSGCPQDAISLRVATSGFPVSAALLLEAGNVLKLKSQNPCKERK